MEKHFKPHEDGNLSRALRHPERREGGKAGFSRGLRFQDFTVKRKTSLNLAEGHTRAHLALTNQSKSLPSNCPHDKRCAPAAGCRGPAAGSLLAHSHPGRQLRSNNVTVTLREQCILEEYTEIKTMEQGMEGNVYFQRERITDVPDIVQGIMRTM